MAAKHSAKSKKVSRSIKIKSKVKAGSLTFNANARTDKARKSAKRDSKPLKVKSKVKAGGTPGFNANTKAEKAKKSSKSLKVKSKVKAGLLIANSNGTVD